MELFSLSDNEGWLYVIVEPNVGLELNHHKAN